jgi:hypothetical protein
LNQGDDTYRSPSSESSNVAIQESGKGNSATVFSDQSNNLQQQQNQPTSLQQQDPRANKDKDNKFPITLNVLPDQRITNTNVNPNRNTASSNSSSASDAANDNTINNTALARQRQADASCAVGVTCPEGSTTVTPTPPTTGTLVITKVCPLGCSGSMFSIEVQFGNKQVVPFTLGDGQTQVVTLDPGRYTVVEEKVLKSDVRFDGDCMPDSEAKDASAIGTIGAGQTLHCTITNFPPPTPPTSTCNPDKIVGQAATPTDGTCTANSDGLSEAQAAEFAKECEGIPCTPTRNEDGSFTCTFPSTPPT